MRAGLFIIILTLTSLIDCNVVDFIRLFDGGKMDLVNGKPNGKECDAWSHVTNSTNNQSDTKFLTTCFDPKSQRPQCYMELTQFKPAKNLKILNLVLDVDYIPDDKLCTGRCGLDAVIIVYRSGVRPETITMKLPKDKSTKVYRLKNHEKINALYFRITPIDFCGKIRNVRLFIGKVLCDTEQLELVDYPSFVKSKFCVCFSPVSVVVIAVCKTFKK